MAEAKRHCRLADTKSNCAVVSQSPLPRSLPCQCKSTFLACPRAHRRHEARLHCRHREDLALISRSPPPRQPRAVKAAAAAPSPPLTFSHSFHCCRLTRSRRAQLLPPMVKPWLWALTRRWSRIRPRPPRSGASSASRSSSSSSTSSPTPSPSPSPGTPSACS